MIISKINKEKRIYTIEDTRELNIAKYGSDGRMINRIIQTVTKNGTNPVTMNDLLKEALRFHPYAIIPAEMRGAEALTAVEAGRTGHVILSTLHANSAVDAYNRILSMCVETGVKLSENKLMEFILEAMPLILFKRQLADGRRVYDEIFEGTRLENGRIEGNTLFKYDIRTKQHIKCEPMSEALRTKLLYGGASEEQINRFL